MNSPPFTFDILERTSGLSTTNPVIQNQTGVTEKSPKSIVCSRSPDYIRPLKQPPKPKTKPSKTNSQNSAAQSTSQLNLCSSPSSSDVLQITSNLKTTPTILQNSIGVNENSPESIDCLKSTNRRLEQPPKTNPKPLKIISQISNRTIDLTVGFM